MVGPVNGSGAYSQQAQIANPFQQQDSRQAESLRQVQESAQVQKSGVSRETTQKREVQTASSAQESRQTGSNTGNGRGSLIDITV